MQTLIHGNEETDIYAMLFSRSSFPFLSSPSLFLLLLPSPLPPLLFSTKKRIVPGLSFLIVLTSSTVSARWAVKQTPISPLLTKSIRCSFPATFPPPSSPDKCKCEMAKLAVKNEIILRLMLRFEPSSPPRGSWYSWEETWFPRHVKFPFDQYFDRDN